MKRNILTSLLLSLVIIMTACGSQDVGANPTLIVENTKPIATKPLGLVTPKETAENTELVETQPLAMTTTTKAVENTEPVATQPLIGTPTLAPNPREITFQAADGQDLKGLYYPAAVNPAPLVVLMHWVNGDKSDWYEVAPWLQNRGFDNPYPNPGNQSWWDPTWFPTVPQDISYGVFIFSFRDCLPADRGGCPKIDEDGWLLDAQAAAAKAVLLEGVDPTRIAFIGSSIGADGAIDGCAWLVQNRPGACQGALSLSPGGYLTIPYEQAVQTLGGNLPPVAAWCLADEIEIGICTTAEKVENNAFKSFEIPTGKHGNMLMRPELDPLPMELILDFLAQTIGSDK